jgi:hypothetical protein
VRRSGSNASFYLACLGLLVYVSRNWAYSYELVKDETTIFNKLN